MNKFRKKMKTFLVMINQENVDQIPDPDEALKEEMVKLKVCLQYIKYICNIYFMQASYISSVAYKNHY